MKFIIFIIQVNFLKEIFIDIDIDFCKYEGHSQ